MIMVKIYIDPGHGGADSGATGHGLQEKKLTLQIAQKAREELSNYNNVTVKMSRTNDKTVSLQQRTNEANAWNAEIGRASCRERGKNAMGAGSFREKKRTEKRRQKKK